MTSELSNQMSKAELEQKEHESLRSNQEETY
jgi:hypothetical protein